MPRVRNLAHCFERLDAALEHTFEHRLEIRIRVHRGRTRHRAVALHRVHDREAANASRREPRRYLDDSLRLVELRELLRDVEGRAQPGPVELGQLVQHDPLQRLGARVDDGRHVPAFLLAELATVAESEGRDGRGDVLGGVDGHYHEGSVGLAVPEVPVANGPVLGRLDEEGLAGLDRLGHGQDLVERDRGVPRHHAVAIALVRAGDECAGRGVHGAEPSELRVQNLHAVVHDGSANFVEGGAA